MIKGRKLTEEHKKKIGESNKPKLKGKNYEEIHGKDKSEKIKKKKSLSMKGKFNGKSYEDRYGIKKSRLVKNKIRDSRLNKISSKEHKENISKGLKKFYQSEDGKKLRIIKKQIIPKNVFKKGMIPWNKGLKLKKWSAEDKKKLKGRKSWNKGLKGIYSEETKKKMRESRSKQIFPLKDTLIEVKIQDFLNLLNIEFYPHQYMREIEHKYQCDVFIPSINLIIECDGDYWHNFPFGREIDHIRTKELIDKGFKVLRLWERDIKKMDIIEFKDKLQEVHI